MALVSRQVSNLSLRSQMAHKDPSILTEKGVFLQESYFHRPKEDTKFPTRVICNNIFHIFKQGCINFT